MKLLLALSFSLFATAAMACTDFTGTYRDQESDVYNLTQAGCTSITMANNEGSETLITDGVYRVTEETSEVRVATAGSFIGANLTLNSKIEYLVAFPPEVPTELIPVRSVSVLTKDSAGNIVMTTTVFNSENQVLLTDTATHQKI